MNKKENGLRRRVAFKKKKPQEENQSQLQSDPTVAPSVLTVVPSASTTANPNRPLVSQYERQQQQQSYAKQQELFQQQQLERQKQGKSVTATPPKTTQSTPTDNKTNANTQAHDSPTVISNKLEQNDHSKDTVTEKARSDGDTKNGENLSGRKLEAQQVATLPSNSKTAATHHPSNPKSAASNAIASVPRQTSPPPYSTTKMAATTHTPTKTQHKITQGANTLPEKNVSQKASNQTAQPRQVSGIATHTHAKANVPTVQSTTEKQAPRPEHETPRSCQPLPGNDARLKHNQGAPKPAVGSHSLHNNVKTSSVDFPEPVRPYYQNVASSTTATSALHKESNKKLVCTCKHTSVVEQQSSYGVKESVKKFEGSTSAGGSAPPEQGHSAEEDDKEDDLRSLSQDSSESVELSTYEAIVAPTKFLSNLRRKVGHFFFGKKPSVKDIEAGDDVERRVRKHVKKEMGSPVDTNGITDEITQDSLPMAPNACNSTSVTVSCPVHSQPNSAPSLGQTQSQQQAAKPTSGTSSNEPVANQQSTAAPPPKPLVHAAQKFITQPTTILSPSQPTQSNQTQLRFTPHPPSQPKPQHVPTVQMRASAYVPQQVAPESKGAARSQQLVPPRYGEMVPTSNGVEKPRVVPISAYVPPKPPTFPLTSNSTSQSQHVVSTQNGTPQQVAPTSNDAPRIAPGTYKVSQPQTEIAPTNMAPQAQNARQTAVRPTNAASSGSQLQRTSQNVNTQANVVSKASPLQGVGVGAPPQTNSTANSTPKPPSANKVTALQKNHVQQLAVHPVQTATPTQAKAPPGVVLQRKVFNQGNVTTAQNPVNANQAKPQGQQRLPTPTTQGDATAKRQAPSAQANKAISSSPTEQTKSAAPQPQVPPQQKGVVPGNNAAQCKVTPSQSIAVSQQATQPRASATQASSSTSKSSPQVKDGVKTTVVAQPGLQALPNPQSPASQTKSNTKPQTTEQSQVKPSPQPKHAVMTNIVAQSKNVAPQQNQQPQKTVPSDTKGNEPKDVKNQSVKPSPAAAKTTKQNEPELPKQGTASEEKSPLASPAVPNKSIAKASSESKKEIQLKPSSGNRGSKPRRRLTYQEENGNASTSKTIKKSSTGCNTKKTPEKMEIVKPDEIDKAIAIALDKSPYTPTRTLKVMPQIPPAQLDDDDDDAPFTCEPLIFVAQKKRTGRGAKGKYKIVNLRKSVNCCCEDSCVNCTSADDWDSSMAVHNRRKR